MLRVTPRESAAAVKAYFTEEARLDYYADGQEIFGHWIGQGAERLGLEGTVDTESFVRLCDNLHPHEEHSLTPRTRSDRTCGYDINFHSPKSASLVYAWNQDDRIIEAFLRAERETMADIEKEVRTRLRLNGQKDGDMISGNLVGAEFVHLTARPSNESDIPDPHLHSHVFCFNATWNDPEGRFKAGQFREVMRQAPKFQAIFLTRYSNYLMEAGYQIRRVDKVWEIVGVPDELIPVFSKRTNEIEQMAEKLGIKNPSEKDKLGALTRRKKNKELTFSQLRQAWRAAISEEMRQRMDVFLRMPGRADAEPVERLGVAETLGSNQSEPKDLKRRLGTRQAMEPLGEKPDPAVVSFDRHKPRRLPKVRTAMAMVIHKTGSDPPKVAVDPSRERQALNRAIQHSFYRASVVSEDEVLTHAMRLAYGSGLTPEALAAAMKRHPEFIFREMEGQKLVTTRTVLAEEQLNVKWVKAGMGTMPPIAPGYQIKDQKLNEEQRAAVLHTLSSLNRVVAIEGKAGTGKTQLMIETVQAMKDQRLPVLVMAPNTKAVQETLRKRSFPDAQTLEQLLVNEKLQNEYRNGILWVDESSQISVPSMRRLFEVADKMNARVVVSGDQGQHHGVVRGDAMRSLYEFADLKPAMVTQILRQSGEYRQAIELLSQGKVHEGIQIMDELGWIHEMPFAKRYKAIANLYVASADEGMRPFVIAPTHFEGRLVTQEIRAMRKAGGELQGERPVPVLRNIDMTPADRADWRTYRPTWVIEVIKETPGTPAGTRMTVEKIDYDTGSIYVRKPDGSLRYWDVERYVENFGVYRPDTEMIAPGERIEITKNGKPEYGRSKVYNGIVQTVTGFDQFGDIVLQNGMVLNKEYAHLRYGYASTSISAQSTTVNHVIIAESEVSFPAASRQQIYNSAARGRKRVDTFTDSKEGLLEAVTPSDERRSAMELVTKGKEHTSTDNYQEELRAAQEWAESKIQPEREENQKRRTKDLLGMQPDVPSPKGFYEMAEQMGVKPEMPRLVEQLGEHPNIPVPDKTQLPPKQPEKTRVERPRMLP